jgi:twinkle protein
MSDSEIKRASDFRANLRTLYDRGIQRGVSTGWPSLDEFFTLRAREWTLITGIPSHGKSSIVDNLIVNTALSSDWKWALFSAENMPHERHAASLVSLLIGRPFDRGSRQRIDESEFETAMAFLEAKFRWLAPHEDFNTIDRVLELAESLAKSEGIQGLVIDPWNELDHTRPANVSETEHVSRALSKLRRFARAYDVHVILVAHPTKLQRIKQGDGSEAQVYPVPTPYDVSGSAHFRNKADNCLCVWRDVQDPRHETHVHIQKIRFREIGKVGVCQLYYDLPTGQYADPRTGLRPVFDFDRYMREKLEKFLATGRKSREPGEDDE